MDTVTFTDMPPGNSDLRIGTELSGASARQSDGLPSGN